MQQPRSTRVIQFALLLAAFGAVAALVGLGFTKGIDRAVYGAAQVLAGPTLDVAASIVTLVGKTEVALALAVVFAVALGRRAGWIGLAPLVIVVAIALDLYLKTLVAHARPPGGTAHEVHYLPTLLSLPKVAGSFPSSHVLLTAFLGGLLRNVAPRTALLTWLVIVLVAASRIYLDKHWLSDVVGGALLGTALAAATVFAVEFVRAWRRRKSA